MPFKLPKTSSLHVLFDYTLRVEASLLAEEETTALAAPWSALQTRVKEARDAREAGTRALAIAQGKIRAADVKWDRLIVNLSGLAYFHAGKDAKALPYSRLFGTIKADDMRQFGATKAAACGRQLVSDIQQLNHEALNPLGTRLAQVNEKLVSADEQRTEQKNAFRKHELVRQELLSAIEKQITLTEIELLKLEYDRIAVRTYLSPHDLEEDADAAPVA